MKRKFNRRSIRYQYWDYSGSGLYFITICIKSHKLEFGRIEFGEMLFSPKGKLVKEILIQNQTRNPNQAVTHFSVMPNHIHVIISITNPTINKQQNLENWKTKITKTGYHSTISPKPNSLGSYVRSIKSEITRTCRIIDPEFKWQRNYYDVIIRNEKVHHRCIQYIKENPRKWWEKYGALGPD